MNRFWNFIQNEQNDEEVELRISGEIMSDDRAWIYEWFGIPVSSPNAFRKELGKHKGKNIKVWIDSYGGDVFAGAGIYNALKEHDGKVTTIIDGKAMSAASVIAMAGDEIHISPVGIMMIHNPWTETVGEAEDMRHAADVLDEVKETIINAYQAKTGRSRKKISEMMDNETFMSAKTAVKEGFADKILYTDNDSNTDADPIENNFMFSRLAIQNSMAESMNKFFEIARNNQLNGTQSNSAQQAVAPKPQPDASVNNKQKGDNLMFKNVEELRSAYPELVNQIENEAREEGKKQERARIQDIEKISKNIDPTLVNKAKYEEPIDAKELAFQAMQADGQRGQQYLENAQADNAQSGAKNVGSVPIQNSNDNKVKRPDDIVASIGAQFDKKRRGEK
jgi:ATP-dependent Clp endopeptidase proteolytic subunit ClpP